MTDWVKLEAGEYQRYGWRVFRWRSGPPALWRVYDPEHNLVGRGSGYFTMAEAKAVAEDAAKGIEVI